MLIVAMGGLDHGECSAVLCDALIFVNIQAAVPKDAFLKRVSSHWDERLPQGTEHYDS